MQYFLMTIAVASAGAYAGIRLKLPAGAMLGAMATTALVSIIWNVGYIPEEMRNVSRIMAGTLIGSGIARKDIAGLKTVLLSACILIFTIILFSPGIGFIISRLTNMDIATAVFASAPGGMTDMALIADELGGDTTKVVLLQLMRVICVINIFPLIMRVINKKYNGRVKSAECPICEVRTGNKEWDEQKISKNDCYCNDSEKDKRKKGRFVKLCITILFGTAGGIIGIILNIPAGAMIFSMLSVACFNVLTNKGYFPDTARIIAQTVIGGLLGTSITLQDVLGLKEIVIPVFIMVFGLIIINIIIGFLIHKIAKMDLMTALLASAPGGLTEMVLISDDLGADSTKVAILQLLRLVSVIVLFPVLLQYLLGNLA